jgi:hypothetical protein
MSLALALLHYPIFDRDRRIVATNITNFDIHDIARAATVYGVDRYYLIHPVPEQLMFVARVLDHWRVGEGSRYNMYRKRSLERVCTAKDLEQVKTDWKPDVVIGTHARPVEGTRSLSCLDAKNMLRGTDGKDRRVLLVFGTGYGMTEDTLRGMDWVLESIRGAPPADFRHLSVRSAVSIYLDRLVGPC